MDLKGINRRINRLSKLRDKLEEKYQGNEPQYTYHAGFDLGYIKGQISALEDIVDLLKDEQELYNRIIKEGEPSVSLLSPTPPPTSEDILYLS